MKVIINEKEYVEKDITNKNSGYCNSGYCNSGDRNSGNWNSGDFNSGNWNSGYCNSGDRNSGYCNSGDRNSGNWNSGNRNSGYCNSKTPKIIMFNKETNQTYEKNNIVFPDYFYFNLTDWIAVSDMTNEEKTKYPHYAVTEGFLRVFSYKGAWKNSFNKASKEDVAKTLKLPNFNYKVFEEISGITKEEIQAKLK